MRSVKTIIQMIIVKSGLLNMPDLSCVTRSAAWKVSVNRVSVIEELN